MEPELFGALREHALGVVARALLGLGEDAVLDVIGPRQSEDFRMTDSVGGCSTPGARKTSGSR